MKLIDKIELIPIDKIIPYHNNPKEHPPEQIKKIASSIKEFGFLVPVIVDQDTGLVAGHGRYKAAKLLNMEKIPGIRANNLNDAEIKAFRLADNKVAESEWNYEQLAVEFEELEFEDYDLELTGFEVKEIENISSEPEETFSYRKGEGSLLPEENGESFYLTEEELEKFKKYKHILVQFSGGRDSTLALAWAKMHFPDKHILAIYSDTGVEFPGMGGHIKKCADYFKVDYEIVKPQKEWWAWIKEKGWPSIIFRPCQNVFIHKPINKLFLKYLPEEALLIDGSRAKQAVRGSKKSKTSKLPDDKLQEYEAYHPCFGLTDESFQKLMEEIDPPLWRGYEQGFVRTACWCCPGQCGKQAYMLNKIYPGLAEEIRWWEKKIGPFRRSGNESQNTFDDRVRAGERQIKREKVKD